MTTYSSTKLNTKTLRSAAPPKQSTSVLKGPPGLLFGLTLLAITAARLWFGWDQAVFADTVATATEDTITLTAPVDSETPTLRDINPTKF